MLRYCRRHVSLVQRLASTTIMPRSSGPGLLPSHVTVRKRSAIPRTVDSVWTPTRVNAIWIGALVSAFVAAFLGLLYGAWAIFQPFPQTKMGPVSVYIIGFIVLCLLAGWQISKRALMIEKDFGDPGLTTPVILVALAAGCMGIWSASLVASVHTPEASARGSVQASVPGQAGTQPPSLDHEQADIISKSCGGGQYQACANEASREATASLGQYKLVKQLCRGYYGIQDQTVKESFNACQQQIWNPQGTKLTFQQNIQSACDRADVYVDQLPTNQRSHAGLSRCDAVALTFLKTQPTTWLDDPPGL